MRIIGTASRNNCTSFVGKLQSGEVSLHIQQKGNTNAKRTVPVRGEFIAVSSVANTIPKPV